jgi:hypothetical protein
MSVIDGDKPDNHDDDPDDTPPPRGGRPALRVVGVSSACGSNALIGTIA